MSETTVWMEVDSEISVPGRWILLSISAVCLLMGIVIVFVANVPPGLPSWLLMLGEAIWILLWGSAFIWAIAHIVSPTIIRHAAPDVLADVPKEPVICEGSIVHGRLTHELSEDAQGWQFRPSEKLSQNNRILILGFGVPFLLCFAGLLSWTIHNELHVNNWPVAIVCGTAATLLCGGPPFIFSWMIYRAGHRRLCRLTIPRNGESVELESTAQPALEHADLATASKWLFVGETRKQKQTIQRESIRAVQLCPWKLAIGRSGGRDSVPAVQGSLILAPSAEPEFNRLPLLLTGDFIGAARLMQQLASTLNVPYLFNADEEGWKAETIRAKRRPPLRSGGFQS